MASKNAVVVRKAAKLELKEIQNKKITSSQTQALEVLLQDAYLNHRPKLSDYHLRRDLVKTFNTIAKETYGNRDKFPVVVAFGSFVMDIFSAQSDLDLSINFSKNEAEIPRDHQVRVLRKIARKLYKLQAKGEMSRVKPIVKARVPIVKVTDPGTGIECDLSVENWVGMAKSHILHLISAIDERFKKLSLLVKYWAKAHKINSSRDRTLNSLSIVSLVAFHLQTRDPPILPPLSAIFRDGTDPVSVKRAVHSFLNYGDKNKETLAELFFTFLVKLASVEVLWPKGLCASTYKGSWMFKAWDSGVGCISVEDFLERSQNVARAVKIDKVRTIYMCIHSSLSHILTFKDGQSERDKLIELLFRSDPNISQMGKKAKKSKRKAVDRPIPPDSTKTKKRIKGVWGGGSETHASTTSKGGWEGVSQCHASTTTKGVWGGESQTYTNTTASCWGGGLQTYANSATKGGWRGEWQTSANTATDGGWGRGLQTNGVWGGGSQNSASTASKGCWKGGWQTNVNTAINSGWGGGSQTCANSATTDGWRGERHTSANTATDSGWGRGLQTNGGWGGGSQRYASSATKGGWRGEWQTNANTARDSGWGRGSQSYASSATKGGWRGEWKTNANTARDGGWGRGSQSYASSATKGGWRGEWKTNANTARDGGWGRGSQSYASSATKGGWRGEWKTNANTARDGGWGRGSQSYASSATKGGWRGEWKTNANTARDGGWGRGSQSYASSATKGGWRREWQTNANTAIDSGWGGGSQSCVSTAIEGGWREPASC